MTRFERVVEAMYQLARFLQNAFLTLSYFYTHEMPCKLPRSIQTARKTRKHDQLPLVHRRFQFDRTGRIHSK